MARIAKDAGQAVSQQFAGGIGKKTP